jgi:NAD(P)-dependent dehydrogenase (short-subunit alcohol dehydrogenase family)
MRHDEPFTVQYRSRLSGSVDNLLQQLGDQGGIMKLTGKKALITGGNSGIGLATARLFVAEGAKVAITGRDQKTLDGAVAELGANARGYRADVTVADDRKRLFADLAKDFGKLDIVFANAGISGRTPTGATDEAVFENIVHTNLNGAFFTVNSAAPLLNDNASIIFNGSVHNYLGQAGQAAYAAATKGGVVSMARAISADFAPRNIRVNVVAPGATKTPLWKRGARASMSAEESAKLVDLYSSTVPLGRWDEPEELARAVLFLASEDSSYINAVELVVDGGLTGAPFGARTVRGGAPTLK